jgi:hypothetical protein
MLVVQCKTIKDQLITKAKKLSDALLEGFASEIRKQNCAILGRFEEYLLRIRVSVAELMCSVNTALIDGFVHVGWYVDVLVTAWTC